MKKIEKISILLLVTTLSHAVPVTLQDHQILESRLHELGLKHFMDHTRLVNKLGKDTQVSIVVNVVDEAFRSYGAYLKNATWGDQIQEKMEKLKPHILTAILKDHADAIKELKDAQLLV